MFYYYSSIEFIDNIFSFILSKCIARLFMLRLYKTLSGYWVLLELLQSLKSNQSIDNSLDFIILIQIVVRVRKCRRLILPIRLLWKTVGMNAYVLWEIIYLLKTLTLIASQIVFIHNKFSINQLLLLLNISIVFLRIYQGLNHILALLSTKHYQISKLLV